MLPLAGKRGLSVVVAAGPYSTSEDCEYEPLQALLEYCAQHKPDALLLLGPFVDVEHPLVHTGLLEETFDEVFESRVRCTWTAPICGLCQLQQQRPILWLLD